MSEKFPAAAREVMDMRFGCDSLIALATAEDGTPHVRTVNAYYEDGCFYTITWALSGKMRQLQQNPVVAVCGEWFTGHGIGESMGHILDEANAEIASKLRVVFDEWYDNGHVNESDPNTIILRIRMKDGVLFDQGTRYEIVFE